MPAGPVPVARVFRFKTGLPTSSNSAYLGIKKMRLLLICLVLISAKVTFAQENQSPKQFVIQLTLNERYRDTLNWDGRILQAVEAYEVLLKKLEKDGKIILAGSIDLPPRAPEQFELLVLQPMTMDEARGILQQLPVVRSGMMRARLFPFTIKSTNAVAPSAKD